MKSTTASLLVALSVCSFACGSRAQNFELPPRYFAAQTLDFFGAISAATVDEDGLADLSATSQDRNSVLSDAYEIVSKRWMLAEKERVKLEKEKKKDIRPRPKALRFELNKPSYTSVQAYGPYATQAEADSKKAEAEAIIARKIETEAKRKEMKLRMMSARIKKSYEAREALIDKQKELFLTEVSALQDRVRITRIANGSRKVKRIQNGKITKLVKNQHRMMKPTVGSGTATKVDPRAVRNK